jgi:N-acetylglucosaminyldiphosphoundecaprenol N-acetyl-beta-D-mannosaminyltransferase
MTARAHRRVPLLGGEVDLVTPADVFAFAAERIAAGAKGIVANHNLHSLHLIRRSAEMRAFYAKADLIEADGTPLIAWGRLLGRGLTREHRCTYLDWREQFWAQAVRHGWKVFYLGGAPCVAAKGADAIRSRWPGCRSTRRTASSTSAGRRTADWWSGSTPGRRT